MNQNIQKNNYPENPSNLWDLQAQYIPLKKDEPITIIPNNQNSVEVIKDKNNSNNYFYRNNAKNNPQLNINIDNIKKYEINQKSNSYSKKSNSNYRSMINPINLRNNNLNTDNLYDIKKRIPVNKEMKNNNPNSFNKNYNVRNSYKKYSHNRMNKSNIESNRLNNYRYEINNNHSNNLVNNNQNSISEDKTLSSEIKDRFTGKRPTNLLNDNNFKLYDLDINHKKNISKSDDNSNNIFNFNYIYNNNNFGMNIVDNNINKNKNNDLINKSADKKLRKISKKKNYKMNRILNDIHDNDNPALNWTCDYCHNINKDEDICQLCKRKRKGKLLKLNTQLINSNRNQRKPIKEYINRPLTSSKKSENNKKLNRGINREKSNNNSNKKNIKRNTLIGFSSSKYLNYNDNYNEQLYNHMKKRKTEINNDNIKKEYSFTKGSFKNRKYNLYN
jgi:hypothetical protein